MRERLVADIPRELAQVEATGNTLSGYASVFNYPIPTGMNQTTYIRPGAFTRTIVRDREQMVAMFNHGHDPKFGELPIGTISHLEENKTGLYTDIKLHEGPSNEDLRAALSSGALQAMSIQFETEQEEFNDDRTERYIQQVKLWEFGPVVFGANKAAVASLHSAFEWVASLEKMWDGAAAMRSCSSAADFRQIAFERSNDSDPDTAAHWTLPHHPRPGAGPDSTGVGAALAALSGARGGAPDLKESVEWVRSHLQRHQGSSEGASSRPADEAHLSWLLEHEGRDEVQVAEIAAMATRMAQVKE